jgi:hypothetical protein
MSAPEQPTPPTEPTEPPFWSEEDGDAILASAHWFGIHAPRELLAQYKGMHVAIFGEQIIDADRDPHALWGRLESTGAGPLNRILIRYIPTDDEPMSRY